MKNLLSLKLLTIIHLFGVVSWVSGTQEDEVQFVDLAETVSTDSRIIGGFPATIERFPFAVQIILRESLICGGSLITVQNVLSAAHCFIDGNNQLISTNDLNVRAGTVENNSGGTSIRVLRLAVHERYNNPLRDNDIAVLRTSSRFSLSDRIRVAFLPHQNEIVPDNSPITYIGWGVTSVDGQQMSPRLMYTLVNKINREECTSMYQELEVSQNTSFPITENMMCAFVLNGAWGTCHGDAGSPLLDYNHAVVGVVSWWYQCAHPQYPGVNVRVARYSNWINNTVTNLNGSPSVSESRIILLFTLICAMLHWHSS